jgi:TonB-dependent receptor
MRQLTRVTLFFILSAFFISTNIFAQTTGTLKGTLLDANTKEALIGASVLLEGTTLGGATDVEGNFVISKVPVGTYTAVITYVGYKTTKIPNLTIEAGRITLVNTEVAPDDQTLEEVTVVGTRSSNTEVAVISEIKEAQQVVSGISAQQILKSQDRDAAEVVRRIPGVTVVDNRFINIRGLNERYNSVWLNDLNAPSTETDKKSFSFDLIPSNLIDRVLIFKTTSPELPGDYAGGLVKVFTRKPSFNEKSLSVSYSIGIRAGTTFNNFIKDKSSSLDFLGFGAKDRSLSNVAPQAQGTPSGNRNFYQIPFEQAQTFKNTYGLTEKAAIPDQRLNLSYLTGFKIGEQSFGSLTAINYSNTFTRFTAKRGINLNPNGIPDATQYDDQNNNNVRLGILQHFIYSLSNGGKIEFRNMFNQIARNQDIIRDIVNTSTGVTTQRYYSLGYQSRSIYNGQLAGNHSLGEKLNIDWILGYAASNKKEPDLRRSSYNLNTTPPVITLAQSGRVDLFTASRLFQDLKENMGTVTANAKYKPSENIEIAAGTYIELKDRKYKADNYGLSPAKLNNSIPQEISTLPIGQVFAPQNFNADAIQISLDPNSYSVTPGVLPNYYYNGQNKLYAFYASGNFTFSEKIKLLVGARYEHNIQSLDAADVGNQVKFDLTTDKILPSVNLSYNLNEKSLIRAAYGRSLNRPEFRELAPGQYYDFDRSNPVYGSTSQQSLFKKPLDVANIDNFDLRYEWYPSEGENVHFGVFYKKFTNPIEELAVNQTSQFGFTYINTPSAYDFGLELDIRKSLNFMDAWFGTKSFKNFTLLLNTSLIKSEVDFTGIKNADTWTLKRSLQGQSPYVVNAGIYYQSEPLGLQISALYNVFGPRIISVGSTSGNYPDIIEMPRNIIDLTVTKNVSEKLAITAGVSDLLNQSFLWVQDFERNQKYSRNSDPRLQDYRRGTYFSLGLRYNPF